MPRLLLRIEEAADEMRIGRSKAYALARSGELPTVRIGRSVRISREALERFVTERATGGDAARRADAALR